MTPEQIKILELELKMKALAIEKKDLIKKGMIEQASTIRDKEQEIRDQLKQLI